MKEFIKKMLHLGAELQKADDAFHCSMIIHDAEILYKNEIEALTIQRVSQQRELLLAYDDWHFKNEQYHSLSREQIVDKYLKDNNCG